MIYVRMRRVESEHNGYDTVSHQMYQPSLPKVHKQNI